MRWCMLLQFGQYQPSFLLGLPCVSDVRSLSPSLSAPGQAAEEPAEERKQRRGEELEGGMDG